MKPAHDLDADGERRRFARISNQFFLRYCRSALLDQNEEEEKIAGIVHDITVAGLAFLTIQVHQNGDILHLEIELAGLNRHLDEGGGLLSSGVVITQATVVRTEMLEPGLYLVAARFAALEENDRELLAQAISYQQNL